MPDLEHSGGESPEDKLAKAKQQQENEGQISKTEKTHEGNVEGQNQGNAGSGVAGGADGDAEVSYPPRTKKAREECQHVVDVMNQMTGPKKRKVVSVITHEDDTVSVGFSCEGSEQDKLFASQLEKKLNQGAKRDKYRVSGESMPTDSLETVRGSNEAGICAEPKVVQAAHVNTSKIDGMDTRWRSEKDPNPYPYTGKNADGADVSPNQMDPCGTCSEPNNIKEYMNYAKANK